MALVVWCYESSLDVATIQQQVAPRMQGVECDIHGVGSK